MVTGVLSGGMKDKLKYHDLYSYANCSFLIMHLADIEILISKRLFNRELIEDNGRQSAETNSTAKTYYEFSLKNI